MIDEGNKQLVRRHFEQIWNHRNLSACEELMARDFVEHAAAPFADTAPGAVDGPQAMRGTVEWLVSQFPDIHMRIDALVSDGDIVVARITSEGTNTGKLNGFLPPSADEISMKPAFSLVTRVANRPAAAEAAATCSAARRRSRAKRCGSIVVRTTRLGCS